MIKTIVIRKGEVKKQVVFIGKIKELVFIS